MVQNKKKRIVTLIILYFISVIIALIFAAPFFYAIINALRDKLAPPVIVIPSILHWENFYWCIARLPFWIELRSTVVILLLSVGLGLPINYLLGFAFARMNAPLKDMWFSILISLMMIPGVASQIPQYVMFTKMHLNNTYWIWLLMALGGSSYFVFLFRQFIQGIPKELEEAASIDGAGTITTIVQIFVPNTVPVIAVVFMFQFLNSWGDINLPFMYLDNSMWPLANALSGVYYTLPNNSNVVFQPWQLAFACLFMIPPAFVYFFGQKYLKEGLIASGLKG